MSLVEKLDAYGHSDYVPFHMPGHKRMSGDSDLTRVIPWEIDITEIDGFDNLHHAEGILKESMEMAAAFYGTKQSFYCINGSTGGILSAISAVTNPGDTILMGRNCHKSAYHAVFLRGLKPVYVYPQIDEKTGIGCGYHPEKIRELLNTYSEIKAVFLTSPTYEGVVSDIHEIAEIVHSHGLPLIVDEAHGAHFTMEGHRRKGQQSIFPVSAVCQGADIVVQSLHKTLPALTQTAIVHVNGELAHADRVQMYLGMFQTSSPSYVLMASIDSCVRFLISDQGHRRRSLYEERLSVFRQRIKNCPGFYLMDEFPVESIEKPDQRQREKGEKPERIKFWHIDPSKLPVVCEFMDGKEFYDCLLKKYHIQCEMCTGRYVLLMTSMFDTEEMDQRLIDALGDMWKEHQIQSGLSQGQHIAAAYSYKSLPEPEAVFTPQMADQMAMEEVSLRECVGRISAEYAYQYPPGIPLLVPGERIDGMILKRLQHEAEKGLKIEGLQDKTGMRIKVLKDR